MVNVGTRGNPNVINAVGLGILRRIVISTNLCNKSIMLRRLKMLGIFFYASYDSNGKKLNDIWYIDNGCSNHMTSRKDLLANINKNVKAKVQVGIGVLVSKGHL